MDITTRDGVVRRIDTHAASLFLAGNLGRIGGDFQQFLVMLNVLSNNKLLQNSPQALELDQCGFV
jgi:hypothetical protein